MAGTAVLVVDYNYHLCVNKEKEDDCGDHNNTNVVGNNCVRVFMVYIADVTLLFVMEILVILCGRGIKI